MKKPYDDDFEGEAERILFLTDVDETPVISVMGHLFTLSKKDKTKPIYIVINTFGGSVYDMFALYDAIKFVQSLGVEVNTIGIGKIMSAGVLLLASGTHRKIGKNASIMYHWGFSEASGNIFQMEVELAEAKRLEYLCNDLLCHNTKMDTKQIEELLLAKTDVYVPASKAIELGIADGFLETPEVPKKSLPTKITKKRK